MLWIGIDVGGTFTDAVAYDQVKGTFAFAKAPSTPADPTRAVLDVLAAMTLDLGSVERLVHGVTIGTNAVLEGKGAEVWMLVTEGFRDVLEIGRTNRPVLYDIRTQKAPPLVPRTRAVEIDERLLFDGSVLRAINADEVERLAERIPNGHDVAIAVCFLHSYANPAHELAAKAAAEAVRPGQFVCTSHEVLPQFREYERFNTTALNAYIGPLIDTYLTRLENGLRHQGFSRDLHIMTSAGGVATAARARRLPVSTVLSGPAAGVAAAVHLGAELGIANIITCDMGGTSTDVCLIENLKVPVTSEQKISHYANRTPQIEINSVGAGGGSIAWLDAGDILMVGPQSAGATPGPVCYGRGGKDVTVTDANLALNRLSDASPFASGHIPLDRTLGLEALHDLGRRVGLDAIPLADGIVRIAIARMVSAIKQISIANGHDPRDFVLLPYGGAGPMHAAAIADELEISRILVPIGPGNFAAFGALISDIRFDYTRTRTMQLDGAAAREIAAIFSSMESEARDHLRTEGVADAQVEIGRALGMRYLGQSWELVVDLPNVPGDADLHGADNIASVERIIEAFADVHDRRFGHRSGGSVEIVSFRLTAVGRLSKPRLPLLKPATSPGRKPIAVRKVYFGGGFIECPVYARDGLMLDEMVAGPAVIEESGSTTIVPPGWTVRTISHGELLMERSVMHKSERSRISGTSSAAARASAPETIDPITLEVVCEGLIAIVREMRANIIRASYSSVIYEMDDFSCALFAPDGQLVAQWWDHPGHVLPLPWGVRCAFEDFKDDIHPGDVLLLNDPYRGGTHLNDVTVIFPVFDQAGRMMIFPAVRAHWVDVGGMVPGSYSGLSTNIYQEGVRIPPIKIWERGVLNRSAMTLLMANMRIPVEREGDLNASIGACRIAAERVHRLVGKYGSDLVSDCIRIHLDRTERRLRARIAELPDGDYRYEDYLEFYNDGRLDPVLARLKLTVAGDQITADFTGSNVQVPGVVNNSLAVAGAGVFVAIKATLDPGGAINEGAFRPITLKAPAGTIFNVALDAPAGAHGEVRKRAVSVALGALAQIIPDKVSGDLCGSSFPNAIGGWNPRRNRPFVYYEAPAGGNGGLRDADGASTFVNVDFGNLPSIHNAESIENEMPLMIESCSLRTDGGGAGQFRGGVGMVRRVRLLEAEAQYSVLSDRGVIPPWGILGAGSGLPYHLSIERNGQTFEFGTPGKVTGHRIVCDDVVVMRSSGGGGYGDPLTRDPRRVAEDVERQVVSVEAARHWYGVFIAPDGRADDEATAALRAKLTAARFQVRIVADDALDPYIGLKGRHRILELAAADAARLAVADDSLVEMFGRHPAPLRAWVRVGGIGDGTVRMDAFGRSVLGVGNDDPIYIRRVETPDVPKGLAGSTR